MPVLLLLYAANGFPAPLGYLNQVREAAGMPRLQWQSALADAAQAHSDYLAANPIPESGFHGGSAHRESPGLQGFTGVFPAVRALAQGYPHRQVLENVSSGDAQSKSTPAAAIDGLMSAIYHRFGFLDFSIDELGIGSRGSQFTFLMGRSDLRLMCLSPPPEVLAKQPEACAEVMVNGGYMQRLCATLPVSALLRQPWPTVCGNGQRLDRAYMQRLCDQGFPSAALLRGAGRYYSLCTSQRRVSAAWFDAFCASPPAAAAYRQSGRYYAICEPAQRVDADWLDQHCAAVAEHDRYRDSGRYQQLCEDQTVQVRTESIAAMERAQQRRSPDVVMWPADAAVGISPVFFEEDPDPLPDQSVSGYPISLQFNPATVGSVQLASFKLFKWVGARWRRVTNTRLLDQGSDPQQQFGPLQFALFPLQRLDWAGRYRVEVEARVDGALRRYRWGFATKDPGGPLFTINGSDQRIKVAAGERPLLYLPPRGEAYSINGLKVAWRGETTVKLSSIDGNTARLVIDWRNCLPVTVSHDDGRSVIIQRRGCE